MTRQTEPQGDPWGERLPRRLGVLSAMAIVVGSTIGSGIFRTPAVVATGVGSVVAFLLAWVLGGVVALCGALSYAELSAMMPRSGGSYVYLRRAYGPLVAFLFGWAQLWVLRPCAFGAIAITSSAYLWRTVGIDGTAPVLGGPLSLERVTAIALLVVVGAVNVRGIRFGALVQNVSTVLKMGALLVLVLLGLAFLAGGEDPSAAAPPRAPAASGGIAAFGLAMVSVLWAYDGWSDVGYVSGEIREPQRTLPRAFVLGTFVVMTLYLLANAAYLSVVPLAAMPGSELIAADVAETVLGPAGVLFVSGAVALSTFGTLNGSMMTSPRIFFAMAEDGVFFRRFSRVHPRHGTPAASIALAVVLGSVFVSVRTFAELADLFVIGIWPFYALSVLAVLLLRRRAPEVPRPYRTWGYPVVPAVFLVATAFLLGNYLVLEPLQFLGNLAIIATGIPVYFLWIRRNARRAALTDGPEHRGALAETVERCD
ncbi:MAG: amino acid permease [Pseudomonadota bacterium]